jgi:hypothetical protein
MPLAQRLLENSEKQTCASTTAMKHRTDRSGMSSLLAPRLLAWPHDACSYAEKTPGQEDAAEGGAAVLEEDLSFYRIQTDRLLVKPDGASCQ